MKLFREVLRPPCVIGFIEFLIGRDLSGNAIEVRDHCYGCTAGQGSSCGGALEDNVQPGGQRA